MVLLRTLLGLIGLASAINAYILQDHYDVKNFDTGFQAEPIPDPTEGYVKYVDEATATNQHLLGGRENEIYIGADHQNNASPPGRMSVRVKSKNVYTKGLFVFDVSHMPVGCGVWPAIWTFGDKEGEAVGWPNKGEIDVIEGVHNGPTNSITLHSGPGCSVTNAGSVYEGVKPLSSANCNAGQGGDGCKQETTVAEAYGAKFNELKGGIYAMEWTDDHIAIWFFPRNAAAPDLSKPNPASWGKPQARFSGCDFKSHFRQHRIIINITMCGKWAGAEWGKSGCQAQTGGQKCEAWVGNNPKNFQEAFWQIRSISVFRPQ